MRRILLGLLAATACITPACASQGQPEQPQANAQNNAAAPTQSAAATPKPDADPAMWVVKDDDTTIYMFGTFHLLDGRTDWFNDEVKIAFDQAQEVVFEVPHGSEAEMAAALQPLIMHTRWTRPGGPFRKT